MTVEMVGVKKGDKLVCSHKGQKYAQCDVAISILKGDCTPLRQWLNLFYEVSFRHQYFNMQRTASIEHVAV